MQVGWLVHPSIHRSVNPFVSCWKSFPGSTSKELLYYVEPTLKNKKFDNSLLHVGVNDLLNDESQDSVENLLDNLKQIGLKCKSAKLKGF